jgi:uncharacterized protein (DUF1778 family)
MTASRAAPKNWSALDRAERIVLSERDTLRVAEPLEHPPEPTPALLAAARRARGRLDSQVFLQKVK